MLGTPLFDVAAPLRDVVMEPLPPRLTNLVPAQAKDRGLLALWQSPSGGPLRLGAAALLALLLLVQTLSFVALSVQYAHAVSQPSLMYKARLRDGREIIVDDYVKGYEWIKENTPQDSRILSWWDYGYQIAGIANRTTVCWLCCFPVAAAAADHAHKLADGNTWNLEHIALIGKASRLCVMGRLCSADPRLSPDAGVAAARGAQAHPPPG